VVALKRRHGRFITFPRPVGSDLPLIAHVNLPAAA
jgi:hypothetical protein